MSAPNIVEEVMRYPGAPLIVLTGGEPALHIDDALIKALKLTGKTIAIETNGTLPLPDSIDWVTLSPKTSFPGGTTQPCDRFKTKHRFLQPCYVDDSEQRLTGLQATVKAVLENPTWRLSLQTHRTIGIK